MTNNTKYKIITFAQIVAHRDFRFRGRWWQRLGSSKMAVLLDKHGIDFEKDRGGFIIKNVFSEDFCVGCDSSIPHN